MGVQLDCIRPSDLSEIITRSSSGLSFMAEATGVNIVLADGDPDGVGVGLPASLSPPENSLIKSLIQDG